MGSAESTDPPPLPTFDARLFEPPSWAAEGVHTRSMKSGDKDAGGSKVEQTDAEEDQEGDNKDHASDDGYDALGIEADGTTIRFTTAELTKLLEQAEKLKAEGNTHFLAKPQRLDDARTSYLGAAARLPSVPAGKSADTSARIVEIEEEEREDVHARIRTCAKAVWGNLGAVYMGLGEHKEAVDACTKALEIDPTYAKVLQRRAAANEAIGTWSSLGAAQEDYKRLIPMLPKGPQLTAAQRSLAALPARITVQQEKEKDEMLGKLKDLGNGLLGKFGLSTDMFKFDQQPGGGYNVRFEK